jgi:hypothetical protein
MDITVNKEKTKEFSALIRSRLLNGISSANAEFFAKNLGAFVNGQCSRFLFWHPDIKNANSASVELFIPLSDLIYDKPDQHSDVLYYRFEIDRIDEFAVVVLNDVPAGNRARFGAFYQFVLEFENGEKQIVRDPMAWSLPYGIHAPAELYDAETVRSEREDSAYYRKMESSLSRQEDNRLGPSANLLEVHTGTATLDGTLYSLTQRYRQIAAKIKSERELSPDEKNLSGFDGIELMPVHPVIENPDRHSFWSPIQKPAENGSEITIHLRKPAVINWGYDVVIFGSAALNPSILSTGRPHELLDLIETLHNFPGGPIKVVLDVVYGHAANQARSLLPDDFFAGPNMYGQNIDFKHPLVRAVILEMHRRFINWGFDGIRVDAAQDITYYDAEQDVNLYDDEFLKQMSDIELNVAGITYKPWMIFEDGRPWPRDDWELACTHRDLIEQQKHPFQWGPMIFAYNTPYHYTYWVSKWWRLKEQMRIGEQWITGYANHDTMRRGTQANPETINVNFLLGNSLKMVMDNAYNNPSTTLLMNGFLPGVPMDFLQALGNAPWSFVRNTDTDYAIKMAAEEAYFADWQITEIEYRNSRFFKRLKDFGFHSIIELRRFSKALLKIVQATDYQPENIAKILNQIEPAFAVTNWTLKKLNDYSAAWMNDLNEYCNVDMHTEYIHANKADFNLKVREYRLKNTWLNKNFGPGDFLSYREPVNGAIIFYGYRKDPESGKELAFLANMEGQPRKITATELLLPASEPNEWSVALSTPSVRGRKIDQPIRLSISQAVLFEKHAPANK